MPEKNQIKPSRKKKKWSTKSIFYKVEAEKNYLSKDRDSHQQKQLYRKVIEKTYAHGSTKKNDL